MDELIHKLSHFLERTRNKPYTEDEIVEIIKNSTGYWEKRASECLALIRASGWLVEGSVTAIKFPKRPKK